MKFALSNQNVESMVKIIDVILRATGAQHLALAVDLMNFVNSPVAAESDENRKVYELTEEQLEVVGGALDLAIKSVGLNGAGEILQVASLFRTPLPEVVETQIVQEDVAAPALVVE